MSVPTRNIRGHSRHALGALLFLVSASAVSAGEKAVLQSAWVREALPKMMSHAAYLTVTNPGTEAIHLVGASSPQYAKAEIHLSMRRDGIATMARQDQLAIPAGGTLRFKPGSFHIMLMKPNRAIKTGDDVELSLQFGDGTNLTVIAPVKSARSAPQNMHKHLKMN